MKITKGGVVSQLLADVAIPRMFRAVQTFPRPVIEKDKIKDAVFAEMSRPEIAATIKPGMSIAITAGSRGIANVDIITRAVVDFVKSKDAKPFVAAAMGSHGGATPQGQLQILAHYGITEETMGCPIKSSMEVVELGETDDGQKIAFSKDAIEADGIIVSCRIKPHNGFRGPCESGICKMLVVGLGKQRGAERVHSDGMGKMAVNLQRFARVIIEKTPVLFAIPCIENAYDETCRIEAVPADKIMEREPEILKEAFANMPSLIVGECDVLIVNQIGKDFSGSGVDPNVTGTFSTEYASGGLKLQRCCMLDVTDRSEGNCLGTGLASAIPKRLYDKLDIEKMYPNVISSTVIKSAFVPLVLATDKETIQLCIRTCNGIDKEAVRVIRIANSLHIGKIMLSEAYYNDVKAGKYPGLEAVEEPAYLEFDSEDNLITEI